MYGSPYRSSFEVHDDDTNSPLDHQRAISKLTFGLGLLYYKEGKIQFEPLPETPINE